MGYKVESVLMLEVVEEWRGLPPDKGRKLALRSIWRVQLAQGGDLLDLKEEENIKANSQSPSLCNWAGAYRKYVQFIYNVLDCGAGTQMVNLAVSRTGPEEVWNSEEKYKSDVHLRIIMIIITIIAAIVLGVLLKCYIGTTSYNLDNTSIREAVTRS